MATSVSDIQSWRPLNVTPVTGAIKVAGDSVTGAVNALNGVVQIGAGLVTAAAALVPATIDPSVVALNTAVTAAQNLLKDLAILDGQYSVLLVPPVVGTGADFISYISQKVADTSDPFAPKPATNTGVSHAGLLVYGVVNTPQASLNSFKAFTSLFGLNNRKPSNASGLRTFRPAVKTSLVAGSPFITWTYPHPLDLVRGKIGVRGANGATYSTIKAVNEVIIWRRQRSGDNITEEKLETLPFNALVTSYTDTAVTSGTYEYSVEFDYELNNSQTLAVKSNWSKLNLTRKAKNKATGGGSFPKFMGVEARYTIEGFETVLARTNQFLEQFKGADTNFRAEVTNFSTFISEYSNQLTARITALINQLKRVAGNLDVLAKSGLSFVAYEGHPTACLTEIAGKIEGGSATDLYVGMFMNASSESQALANTAIDGIKKLCGWGGQLRVVDTIAGQAQNILKAGTTILQNVESIGDTTIDRIDAGLSAFDSVSGQGRPTGKPSVE